MNELTVEVTNYCPHECPYCSSEATKDPVHATYISPERITEFLAGKRYDRIHISGGEPLSHPHIWMILNRCKQHTSDVVLHTNEIRHIAFNPSVIDGVYVDAYLTVPPETDKVHILRRVKQGREANRPQVHLSKNWSQECSCDHRVLRPDGTVALAPCAKDSNSTDD